MPITSLNRRILIIDDNRQVHGDFAKILTPARESDELAAAEGALFGKGAERAAERIDFTLGSAYQGEEGLREIEAALARGEPYALAFVDMRMPPGWDGLETIARMWDLDPALQIVLCTAYTDYSWAEITARMGPSDRLLILKKPFDTVEVLQLAHALTEKWAMAQTLRQHVEGLGILVDERTRDLQQANSSLGKEVARHQQTIGELAGVRQRLEEVLRSVPLALIGVGADGTITHWNAIAESCFAVPRAEALGASLASLALRCPVTAIHELAESARTEGVAAEVEVRVASTSGGQDAFLVLSATALPGPDGEVLVYGSDVTKRKLVEIQLVNARKLEAIGQLAAGIAHEVNTPTQYIGDNILFLKDSFLGLRNLLNAYRLLAAAVRCGGGVDEPLRAIGDLQSACDCDYLAVEMPKSIEQSLEGVEQIRKIVSAMGDFSRQDGGAMDWSDINAALRSTVNVARSEYKYVADVVLELDAELPRIRCSASQLNQVFLNIVVNAAHAIRDSGTKRRGTIRISSATVGDAVEVRIADDGPGIPDEIQSRIFEPFFTTKPVGKGTGQGLYLSRNIVVQGHRGSLDCESRRGGPTTFIIRLPIGAAELAQPAAPRPAQAERCA